jgi:hypothetical protein
MIIENERDMNLECSSKILVARLSLRGNQTGSKIFLRHTGRLKTWELIRISILILWSIAPRFLGEIVSHFLFVHV